MSKIRVLHSAEGLYNCFHDEAHSPAVRLRCLSASASSTGERDWLLPISQPVVCPADLHVSTSDALSPRRALLLPRKCQERLPNAGFEQHTDNGSTKAFVACSAPDAQILQHVGSTPGWSKACVSFTPLNHALHLLQVAESPGFLVTGTLEKLGGLTMTSRERRGHALRIRALCLFIRWRSRVVLCQEILACDGSDFPDTPLDCPASADRWFVDRS